MANQDKLECAWHYSSANYKRSLGLDEHEGCVIDNTFVKLPSGLVVTRVLYWDGKAISITSCFVPDDVEE